MTSMVTGLPPREQPLPTDGFVSSVGDAALAKKYGHETAVPTTAPPPAAAAAAIQPPPTGGYSAFAGRGLQQNRYVYVLLFSFVCCCAREWFANDDIRLHFLTHPPSLFLLY